MIKTRLFREKIKLFKRSASLDMGKDDYLPVQTNSRSRSSSSFAFSKHKSHTVKILAQLFACSTFCIVFGIYVVFRLSTFKDVQKEVRDSSERINKLEILVNDLEKSNSQKEGIIVSLKTELNTQPNIYDDSLVSFAVYENMESFYKKHTSRWVSSCSWEDCRHQTYPEVLKTILTENKETVSVLQIGYCTKAIVEILSLPETDIFLTIVDNFKKDSPASYSRCRSIKHKQKFRESKSLADELKKLKESKNIFVIEKEISIPILSSISSEFDVVVLDIVEDESPDLLGKVLASAFENLKVRGTMIGHSYAVVTPYQKAHNIKSVPVHWTTGNRKIVDFEIPSDIVSDTKRLVDDFTIRNTEEITSTSGIVTLAGDTTWLLEKRETTLKDLFGGGL